MNVVIRRKGAVVRDLRKPEVVQDFMLVEDCEESGRHFRKVVEIDGEQFCATCGEDVKSAKRS